jgi:hypothetical protein
MGIGDILLLGVLVPRTKQYDDGVSMLSQIDPVSRTEINSQFNNTSTDTAVIAEITHLSSRHARFDFGGRSAILERIKIIPIRSVS